MKALWDAIVHYAKTFNVYAGVIPSAERIEYRTAEQWRRRAR